MSGALSVVGVCWATVSEPDVLVVATFPPVAFVVTVVGTGIGSAMTVPTGADTGGTGVIC